MLTVVTWLWRSARSRTPYTGAHVNLLARMVRRHLSQPHRFVCVTDEVDGIDRTLVDVVPDRRDFAAVPSPEGGTAPSCYRRLFAFHPDAAAVFGERILSVDIDTVVVGALDPLVDRDDDFVIYRDPVWPRQGQGSLFLLTAGALSIVWTAFDPARSPQQARAAGFRGSDQAWVSYCTPGRATWGRDDGVYSYRRDLTPRASSLPGNARVVSFHGRPKPWSPEVANIDWIAEAHR